VLAAIVLVEPGDFIGHAIDFFTGSRGWSHCFVDPGWPSRGRDPIVIDISRENGVELSTWSRAAEGRETCRIELDEDASRCVLEHLAPYLGLPYSFGSMMLQPLQTRTVGGRGAYCSRVVADCLPLALRARLPPCPAPSDLLALRS
jgi:hypothetical protein